MKSKECNQPKCSWPKVLTQHLISHRKISSNLYFSFSAGLSRRIFFIITQINVLSVDTCRSKITLSQIFSLTIYSLHQSGDISASGLNVFFLLPLLSLAIYNTIKKNNLINQFNIQ